MVWVRNIILPIFEIPPPFFKILNVVDASSIFREENSLLFMISKVELVNQSFAAWPILLLITIIAASLSWNWFKLLHCVPCWLQT